MDTNEKIAAMALFRAAMKANDADTATEVIEWFAANGSPISEVLCREFLDAGLGRSGTPTWKE